MSISEDFGRNWHSLNKVVGGSPEGNKCPNMNSIGEATFSFLCWSCTDERLCALGAEEYKEGTELVCESVLSVKALETFRDVILFRIS